MILNHIRAVGSVRMGPFPASCLTVIASGRCKPVARIEVVPFQPLQSVSGVLWLPRVKVCARLGNLHWRGLIRGAVEDGSGA